MENKKNLKLNYQLKDELKRTINLKKEKKT
jgi:hypothetical protein